MIYQAAIDESFPVAEPPTHAARLRSGDPAALAEANGIGIILYFILRDPLLVYCSRCGAGVLPTHAFCPRCGASVQPDCKGCHRTVQTGWTHCA